MLTALFREERNTASKTRVEVSQRNPQGHRKISCQTICAVLSSSQSVAKKMGELHSKLSIHCTEEADSRGKPNQKVACDKATDPNNGSMTNLIV